MESTPLHEDGLNPEGTRMEIKLRNGQTEIVYESDVRNLMELADLARNYLIVKRCKACKGLRVDGYCCYQCGDSN